MSLQIFFVVMLVVAVGWAVYLFEKYLAKEDARGKLAAILEVKEAELPNRFLKEVGEEIKYRVNKAIKDNLSKREKLLYGLDGKSGQDLLIIQLEVALFEEDFKRLQSVKKFFLS